MLVLSRRIGQSIMIGNEVEVIVQRVQGNRVTLSIKAPREVSIVRGELLPTPEISVVASERAAAQPEEATEALDATTADRRFPPPADTFQRVESKNDHRLPSRQRSRRQVAPTFSTAAATSLSVSSLPSRIG
ncbi:MAG: hypothetical protein RIS70_1614 [Planctomycetota bacterium]